MTSRLIARSVPYIAAAALALTGLQAFGATATINPSQDNTVAQELPDNSSGACDSIFSGNIDDQTVPAARRALIQFDIAGQIPPGSIIDSVTLNMAVTRGGNHTDSTFDIHPITAGWVEGPDDCGVRGGGQGVPATGGAVTWNNMPGFGASSGNTVINNTTPVWNSTGAMVADVQNWLDTPGTSNGWMVIGDEVNPTTTRRFGSREGASAPSLLVAFDLDPNTPVEACCEADGSCSLTAVGSGSCGGAAQGDGTTCEPNLCPQPTGACCNVDRTCSTTDPLTCDDDGGTFVGGNCNQADCGLTPFVEALPIPPILQPTGTRADGVEQYTVSVEEAVQSVHPDLPDTTVWTYNGAWPSSTIVATKDVPIEVTYVNNLPTRGGKRGSSILEVDTCAHGPNDWGDSKRIVTHLHGAHLPARFDGQPEYTILPGESDVYQYPNDQDAATVWYHDHALGITRLNVYSGMAGFYLIRDNEDTLGLGDQTNALNLPSLGNEIGLAIQDRTFNTDGSLFYNAQLEDAFKGEYAVVNGKVNPYLNVNQGKYRFRMLNGSQSREYIFRLENITDPGNDPVFTLIGTDLGLIGAPINMGNSYGIHGPAERMDVVIDFSVYPAGTEIILRNDDPTPPLLPNIMKFIVTDQPGHTDPLPATLRAVTAMPEGSEDATRYYRFKKDAGAACKDGSARLVNEWLIETLDGPGGTVKGKYWDDLTEFPILGDREIWEFENPTNSYHPMHVHLVRFQILSKTDLTTGQSIPLQPWEVNTWKDVVHVPANTRARVIMDFEDYPGRFPSHCHLLDHEDHEMMRQFQTINPPSANCGNGTCDPGEDCRSCEADCVQVSGAFCGNGLCEAGDGENCATCAEDCAGKQKGSASGKFCCGFDDGQVTNPIGCGADASDNRCIDSSANVYCRVTARLSACCGDAMCEGAETESSCANDCGGSTCTTTEPVEVSCFDVSDNDCDGLIDCADNDCNNATEPSTCGVGVCAASGELACQSGDLTNSCTPLPATEPGTELTCDNGLDDDCDGLADGDDPDCGGGGVVCEDIEDKGTCNNEVTCEWQGSPKNGNCVTVGGGVCTDGDGDGYGDPGDASCSNGAQTDCNDTNASVNPGAVEGPVGNATCNDGLDNNCDGLTDGDDPNCGGGGVVCEDITTKSVCNNEPTCRWSGSPQNGSCGPT